MSKIKRKFGLIIAKTEKLPFIRKLLINANHIFFHFNERERMVNKKNKSDQIYYVIRPQSRNVGLLALYFFVLRKTKEALDNGYIPVVDFETVKCQYSIDEPVNGTQNAWEYYFRQPAGIGIKEISADSKKIYSGWRLFKEENALVLDENILMNLQLRNICIEQLKINENVKKLFDLKYKQLLENKRTLGVFIRGTDYVALKPKGHNIQPDIESVISKVKEFLNSFSIAQVFVVTEDYDYYSSIKDSICCPVISSDDEFVKNYNSSDYVSESISLDGYSRGLNYLIRLLLLTKCEYIVSSYASGSIYSKMIREEKPKAEYWFDLGKY